MPRGFGRSSVYWSAIACVSGTFALISFPALWPHQLAQWTVFLAAAGCIYQDRPTWAAWLAGAVAVIHNPIAPIHFDGTGWKTVHWLTTAASMTVLLCRLFNRRAVQRLVLAPRRRIDVKARISAILPAVFLTLAVSLIGYLAFRFQAQSGPAGTGSAALDPIRTMVHGTLLAHRGGGKASEGTLFPTYTAAANAERERKLKSLFTGDLEEVLPPDKYAELQARAAATPEPAKYIARQSLKAYLQARTGQEIPGPLYPLARGQLADALGVKDDDEAVAIAIGELYRIQTETDNLLSDFGTQIAYAVLEGRDGDATRLAAEALAAITATSGPDTPVQLMTARIDAWQPPQHLDSGMNKILVSSHLQAVEALTAIRQTSDSSAVEQLTAVIREAQHFRRRAEPTARGLARLQGNLIQCAQGTEQATTEARGNERFAGTLEQAVDELMSLPPGYRIAAIAQARGFLEKTRSRDSFFERLIEGPGNAVSRTMRTAIQFGRGVYEQEVRPNLWNGIPGRTAAVARSEAEKRRQLDAARFQVRAAILDTAYGLPAAQPGDSTLQNAMLRLFDWVSVVAILLATSAALTLMGASFVGQGYPRLQRAA